MLMSQISVPNGRFILTSSCVSLHHCNEHLMLQWVCTLCSLSLFQACIIAVLVSRSLAGVPEFAVSVPAYAASPIYHAEPPKVYQSAPAISYSSHTLHTAPSATLKTVPILKTYESFESAPVLKTFEATPILKSYAPAPVLKTYEPATILKSYEPVPAPVAIKTPGATSYATSTSLHVTHPVAKVATAPVLKYEAVTAPALSFHSEPLVKLPAPTLSLKTLASPLLSYSHETPTYAYAPSYSHELESYGYH